MHLRGRKRKWILENKLGGGIRDLSMRFCLSQGRTQLGCGKYIFLVNFIILDGGDLNMFRCWEKKRGSWEGGFGDGLQTQERIPQFKPEKVRQRGDDKDE